VHKEDKVCKLTCVLMSLLVAWAWFVCSCGLVPLLVVWAGIASVSLGWLPQSKVLWLCRCCRCECDLVDEVKDAVNVCG
jgi:hypothetical protein